MIATEVKLNRMNVHVERARAAIELKRWPLALEALAHALGEEPEDPYLHVLRSEVLYRSGNYRDSRRAAHDAIALAPEWSWAYYWLAWGLLSDVAAGPDRVVRAAPVADAALAYDPDDPTNHYLRAEVGRIAGRPEEGLVFAYSGLRLDPEHTPCLQSQAACEIDLNEHAEAERSLRRLLALSPESLFGHENLAKVLLEQGRFVEAYNHAKTAVNRDPTDPDIVAVYREAVSQQHVLARGLVWLSKSGTRYPYAALIVWLVPLIAVGLLLQSWNAMEGTESLGLVFLPWTLVFIFHERLAIKAAETVVSFSPRFRHLLPNERPRLHWRRIAWLGAITLVVALAIVLLFAINSINV